MNPRFPLYVVSKGRWDTRYTSKALESMGVPYRIVVEEQEAEAYASVIDPSKVLVLDKRFQDEYDTSDDPRPRRTVGAGAARNFVWAHSIAAGHAWHWVMDDNIRCFRRLNRNEKVKLTDGTGFRCMEDFVLRFENVAMAGPNYCMFASARSPMPPAVFNTRIYSCNLIRNDIPFRWRGRYNEDTDLSLRILKAGLCTVQFNAFLQEKMQTMRLRGGNTDELYRQDEKFDGRLAMAQSLQRWHPDVCRITWKWGRWQHQVDYRPFKGNRLVMRPGEVYEGVNEYGMELRHLTVDET